MVMHASLDSLSERHRLDHLPSFPPALVGLSRLLQDPDSGPRDIERYLRQDAALSLRVLAAAASPVFSDGGPGHTLQDAVRLLGPGVVRSITVASGVMQYFRQLETVQAPWWEKFWARNLFCAGAARLLASSIDASVDPEQAHLAGLLHDPGRPILAALYPEEFAALVDEAEGGDRPLRDLERERFGHSHHEVSVAVLERCGLDGLVVDAARYHHCPAEGLRDAHLLIRLVHVATCMADAGAAPSEAAYRAAEVLLDMGRTETARIHRQASEEVDGLLAKAEAEEARQGPAGEADRLHAWRPLLEGVRQQASLGSLQVLMNGVETDNVMEGLERALLILFGVESACCFQLDEDRNILRLSVGSRLITDLGTLEVALDGPRSVVSRALLETRPLHTLDETPGTAPAVLDKQLTERLGGDGMLCLPLHWQGRPQGVLVMGIRETQLSALLDLSSLLLSFGQEAGKQLAFVRSLEDRREQCEARHAAHLEQERTRFYEELADPLTSIRNYLYVLRRELPDRAAPVERLDRISREVERMTALLDRFLEPGNSDR